jgi:hypothetical protein
MSGHEATTEEREAARHEEAVRRAQVRREGIASHELDAMRTAFMTLNKLSPSGQTRALDFLHSCLRDAHFPEEVPF